MQSVLVTVDRHEWYAPPQIYTRNDSSGLWTVKPVLPLDSPLLSPGISPIEQDPASNVISSCAAEVASMEQAHQCVGQEPMDGVTSMETSCEQTDEGSHSLDESDSGTKKRRVDGDLSADGVLSPDCSLHEPREERLEDPGTETETVLRDYQGGAAVATNASVAERVIEPTLVMLEVKQSHYNFSMYLLLVSFCFLFLIVLVE